MFTADDAEFGMWPSANKVCFNWFCPPTVESKSAWLQSLTSEHYSVFSFYVKLLLIFS